MVNSESPSDPGMYGRSFAEVYDQWYADAFDTAAAVAALTRLAANGSALELGVGTGRLAIPVAANGVRVVGIDASPEMLDQLRGIDTDGSVISVCGDMASVAGELRSVGINDTYSLIFCAYNTLLNLDHSSTLMRCLTDSRDLLTPDGRLVIEAFVPVDPEFVPLSSLTPARVRSDAAVFIETHFDPAISVLYGQHLEVRAGSVSKRPWSILLWGPERIDAAAQRAGFTLVERWADWNGKEFTDASTSHISIYRQTA